MPTARRRAGRARRRRRGSRRVSAASFEETVIIGPSERALAGVRHPVADAAQVGHEQHRLHQARAHVHAVRARSRARGPSCRSSDHELIAPRAHELALDGAQIAPTGREARRQRAAAHRAAPAPGALTRTSVRPSGEDVHPARAAVGGRVERPQLPSQGRW